MTEASPERIRIWADLACPWCWIGHRRLERALELRGGEVSADLAWQPYQLQPDLPEEGAQWARILEERFDGADRARFLLDHITGLGRAEGLEIRFDRMTRAPNTARAHGLVLAAAERGLAWPVALRLFREHFSGGADLADPDLLARLAREEGVPGRLVSRALEGAYADAVHDSQREADQLGVQGVPFFVIEPGVRLTGAQPPEVFLRALDEAAALAAPAAADEPAAGRPDPHAAPARRSGDR